MKVEFDDAASASDILTHFNYFHDALLKEVRCISMCAMDTIHVVDMKSEMRVLLELFHHNYDAANGKIAVVSLQFNEAVELFLDWRLFADCDWGIMRMNVVESSSTEFPSAGMQVDIEWSVLRDGVWGTAKALSFRCSSGQVVSEVG